MTPDPVQAEVALAEALRRAAAGAGLPETPGDVREHVERLVTDAAAAAFELERERLALERQCRDVQTQLDELRALLGVVRRRFTIHAGA